MINEHYERGQNDAEDKKIPWTQDEYKQIFDATSPEWREYICGYADVPMPGQVDENERVHRLYFAEREAHNSRGGA